MKVLIYIRKVLFLFLCGALSFSYGYGQELPLLPDTIKPLLSDSNLIDELITVGYATGNRSTLSGSVNRVNEGGMNEGLISTPLDALRGRVSGVSIPVGGNSAAALAAVRVRGTTSLTGGNDPLVIIDGVFADLNLLSSIYPADIENFTILKDASETAQYGSRGASGVIEVTTKKGRQGAFSISYDGSFGVEAAYKSLDMLSTNGFRKLAEERNIGILDLGNNTDFQDEVTRLGLVQNHHIAFGGGSETSSYRASLGFVEREGVIRNTNSRNFTTKLNITQHAFNDLLVFDLGIFGSLLKNAYLNDVQKMFYSAATFNPTFPNHKNMETGSWDQITNASQITNPLAWLEVKDDDSNAHINTHLKLVFNLSKHLMFTAFGSYTYNVIDNAQYLPTSVWAHGQAYRGERKTESLLGDFMLAYKKDFGLHQLNVLGLAEAQKMITRGFYTTATNFSTDRFGYDNLQAGAVRLWEGTGSYYEAPHLASFLGRVNYIYDGKYIATVNARADASSKVGANNKWGFFPSASVAWVLTEEEFMEGVSWVRNLKIRLGYGLSGNQDAIDPYQSLSLMAPNGTTLVDGSATTTFYIDSNPNPDLRWEKKYTFDVGVDLAMFQSRLRLTMDYYASTTKDMLYTYTVPVPPFVYTSMLANLGEMTNNGFEVAISGDIIKKKDFSLTVGTNLSFQKNKLKSLSGTYMGSEFTTSKYIQVSAVNAPSLTQYAGVTYLTEGQPLGVFYIPHCNGLVEKEDGKFVYDIADLDGDGKVDLSDSGDRYIAGQALPKVYMGGFVNMRYKDFDLAVQLNGAFGHKIYNGTSLTFNNLSLYPTYNILDGALDKRIYDIKISDYYLENGNYVNIEYITLGYNIPVKKLKIEKYLKSLRLAFSVNNVATITGYSGMTPLINSANVASKSSVSGTLGVDDKLIYPLSRTYSLSLGVKF